MFAMLAACLATPLAAQTPPTPPVPSRPTVPPKPTVPMPTLKAPVSDTGIFAPAPLPFSTVYRSASGAPGAKYWQQRVDYTLAATLDTAAKTLAATETIRYVNNSPDTLAFLWFQMDQNLFAPNSVGSLLNASNSRFGGAGFQGGFLVSRITQGAVSGASVGGVGRTGARGPARPAAGRAITTRVDGTMMYVPLPQPLAPGQSTTIELAYSFNIPEHGADRMGRDGALYELAQWYPRVAVYDDIHGWNTDPYLGQGEFYLEYGDIDYSVTVPAGYIVAGTGLLQNPQDVLTATQRARLALAAKSDTAIAIITAPELVSGAARPAKSGSLTWKFRATNVRDAAWAASPRYMWDASAYDGILANGYYRPEASKLWSEASRMSRASIKEYSEHWFHYPYPQISAIEGPVSGMEYPMVAMETDSRTREELYNVVTHEIGHMWYPMIVGSDERRYAWMDEGFNTFINTFSEEHYFERDDADTRRGEKQFVFANDQGSAAQPLLTPANRYKNDANLGALAYVKPSIVLLALRNKVLGPAVFDSAFREYTHRWAFKHPQPADFFRTMENVTGRDLSWYWRAFFFSTAALDQAIETVTQTESGNGKHNVSVILRNTGQAVMPVELKLTFSDGSSTTVNLPVEIWYAGDRYTARLTFDKAVTAAQLDPDGLGLDVYPQNDTWGTVPAGVP
jgi:hypothetical protein